jgi:serine/threonine protein phosphatase PrpC
VCVCVFVCVSLSLLSQGHHLVIANVGDSRAILATKDEIGALKAIQLTVDLKPNLPKEAERIRQCKGRVFALHDEPEVPRVWLPFDDAPGLAMARAFGDFCLKDYGVIAVPELSHRLLTDQDQFIVLATDGVRLSKTTILFLSTESCHCYLLVKFFC